MEQLSPTAYVILGMIRGAPKSGYEIKAVVDETTRFFWAASYGQIYPELKRLSEAGLVSGVDTPTGGRKRIVYGITAARCTRSWSPWSRWRRPSRTRSR
jgi:DNA-binding PadR family transcriptional regulator